MVSERVFYGLLSALGAVFWLFSTWPQLDLAATALFYQPGIGFPLTDVAAIDTIRRAIWGASILMVLAALLLGAMALVRKPRFGLSGRLWGFILLLYILGPGLLVEWGLKGHWGRARPVTVLEFGGTLTFTPPNVVSDQCLTNCSFVGGESAGATALTISLLLILSALRPRLKPWFYRAGQGIAFLLPLIAGAQRLVTGRHFLSDILLSVLLITLLAILLARVIAPLWRPVRA